MEQQGETAKSTYISNVLKMAWPAVLESFCVALVGMVDSLMVSKLGTYAVAAVGLTAQPKFIGICIFFAMNIAISAVVARRRGEKNQKAANEVFLVGLVFALLAGAVISVVAVTGADFFIRLSGSNADTHDSAVIYFKIIMGGMIFHILSMAVNAALRGAGNTKVAMRTNLTSNLVNLVGNYLLIGGNFGFPALGIRGAAIATVFGTAVACTMSFASVLKKDQFINLKYIWKEKVLPTLAAAKAVVKISSSTFLEQIFLRIGFLSVAVMAAKMGTDEFAAHQVGMNVMSLSFSFGDGMQVAAVALIGRSLGEKNQPLAKRYGRICHRIGLCIGLVLAVLYMVFGRRYFSLYFEEAYPISIGVQIMRVIMIVVILQISQVIYMGCLRGAGDVVFTTIASTISVTCIRPLASYLFAYICGFGIIGIWYGLIADQFCRYLLTTVRFKSGVWMKKVV